jgi:hypothetical protein
LFGVKLKIRGANMAKEAAKGKRKGIAECGFGIAESGVKIGAEFMGVEFDSFGTGLNSLETA